MSAEPIVVALDAGTTGVRAIAFDRSGAIVGSCARELAQYYPQPGWVEHDPVEIWTSCRDVLSTLVTSIDRPVATIGITNQRETVIAWNRRTGVPYHRAIVWQDRRTAPRCDELRDAGQLPLVRARTGLVLDPYFSASKIEWLLRKGGVPAGPDLCVGTVDSWLVWHLSGGEVFVTDATNASRTMLFDIAAMAWSDELCALFGVDTGALAELGPTSGRVAVTSDRCGVSAGIPISAIAGDQQAALFGQACFTPGSTKNTYGTGSFVLMNVGAECPAPAEGLLTTVAWQLADGSVSYALEGAVFVTGAAVQWLRDELGLIEEAADIGPLAASVADTGGLYFVPAFVGLGSPHWDPYARGTLVGITRGSGKAHLARAVVESIAYQSRDVVEAMTAVSGRAVTAMRADGGAAAMDLLLQLQADQLGVEVTRPKVRETTALGAAYLAGLAEGVWGSLDDVVVNWQLDASFTPEADRTAPDARYADWRRAVDRSRSWASTEG